MLTLNEDYTVSYENNINVGTASAVVQGINDYEGIYVINFEIVPAEEPEYPQNSLISLIMMLLRMLFGNL